MLSYLDTAIGFVVVMLAISLLITIATQIVSALLNHRGGNLLWGLRTLFSNIDPSLTHLNSGSGWLAEHVLTHCLISDSWFSNSWIRGIPFLGRLVGRYELASAIRSGELINILNHIATALPKMAPPPDPKRVSSPTDLANDINKLLNATSQAAQREIQMVASAVAGAGFAPAAPAAPAGAAPAVPAPALAGVKDAAVPLLEDAVSAALASAGRLETWFESMMDRVSQRFATWMRIWTVVFACGFALITGLNTMDLAGEIYRNGTLRDSLVGAGQQLSATATTVLDPQNSLSAKYTAVLVSALKAQNVAVPDPAPVISTTAGGTQWINTNVPPEKLQAVLTAFDTGSQEATRKFLADMETTANGLATLTRKAGINVVTVRWPSDFWNQPLVWRLKYVLGVLLTAALLSLGAPFWFNSLKSLTNLRPLLATKQQAEQQQGA